MRFTWAKIRLSLFDRLAFRWSFAFEIFSTCSMLFIFLLIDRFQGGLLGDRLQSASAKLGTSYFGYVTVGLAVSALSSVSLGGVLGQFHEEKRLRTLPLVLCAPLSLWRWALAAGAANFLRAVFQCMLIFSLAVGVLGLQLPAFSPGLALLVILVSLPSLWALSVLSLAVALLIRRGDPLGFVLGISLEILGGVYVPLDVLPPAARTFSQAIPLGPSLTAMHAVLSGGARLQEISPQLGILALLAVIYVPLAFLLLRWADQRARLNGNYFVS